MKIGHLLAALAYTGAAFLFGLALGERGELGFVQSVFTVVIPTAAVVLTIVAKRNRALVLLTGIVMLSGLLLGQRQFARAWDECLTTGVQLHTRLEAFQAETGGYPSRLEELADALPCRCGLRPTILHYLSNERGFRLWMTNDRQTILFTAGGKASR